MNIKINEPPREFQVGFDRILIMKDCAHIELNADEQVTMCTAEGNEYDVARKSWGFYATPSLNTRLLHFKLHAVLVKNRQDQFYVMLVEEGKEALFQDYVDNEPLQIVCWLDDTAKLLELEKKVKGGSNE
jgi:hypothetical protein